VQLDANGDATITTAIIDNGSNDACGIADLSIDITSFDCSNVGANTVTLTVTDNNGNTSICTSTVTVEDNVAPEAICQDITVDLDANGMIEIMPGMIDNGSNDACGISGISLGKVNPTFDCNDLGDNTVTLTVTDNNGNTSTCTSTVTVEDNMGPVISECPMDQVLNNVPGSCANNAIWAVPTITDNCGVESRVFTAPGVNVIDLGTQAFGLFPVGTTTVTLTATDINGNVTTCTFDITVNDVEPPVITNCPSDMTVNADPGECTADVFYGIITASDNCPGVVLDPVSGHMVDGDVFPVGVTNVMFTATDAMGLTTTCNFTITVIDNQDPIITCPADVTIECDASTAPANTGMATATDNCDDAPVITFVDATVAGACANESVITRTWTATASNGQTATCDQIITVNDDTAPVPPT